MTTKDSNNSKQAPDLVNIEIRGTPEKTGKAPQCQISFGDEGLVLSCSSLENAVKALEALRHSLKVEERSLPQEADSASREQRSQVISADE